MSDAAKPQRAESKGDATQLADAPTTSRYRIPTVAKLRPIKGEIAVEPDETGDWGRQTLRMRYDVLTNELPLAGGKAMRRTPSGQLLLIETLRAEAPWLERIIAIIERQLEVQLRIGQPWVQFAPLLLVGSPGCGKSWIAKRLAELCQCGHGIAELAGAMDATIISGNPRGWNAAQPMFPALIMSQTRTANPICIVEEVEKSGGSMHYGDPIAALLNLLEPNNARAFYDKCLLTEVDVSHVSWILTANSITPRLSPAFLSRVEVVEVTEPPIEAFDELLALMLASLCRRWALPAGMAPELPKKAIDTLRADYRRHRSIRRLGQMLERVAGACLPERRLN